MTRTPPPLPATSASDDFRDAPVAASELAVADAARANPSLASDPLRAGMSLCLRAPGDGQSVRRRLKWDVLARAVLGLGGLVGGAVLGVMHENHRDVFGFKVSGGVWLAVAVCCSLGGIFMLISAAGAARRKVRRHVAQRIRLDGRPPIVELEETRTFSKMKAVTEDLGVVLMYPEQRCVVIEGVTHRYLIYAEDVVEVRPVPGPTTAGLGIHYLAAGEPLDITLTYQTVWMELKRQTIGARRNPMLEQIAATLQPPLSHSA